jgi:hypothetical protein
MTLDGEEVQLIVYSNEDGYYLQFERRERRDIVVVAVFDRNEIQELIEKLNYQLRGDR